MIKRYRKIISIDKIVELYNSGLSAYKVATIFNCSKCTILRRLKDHKRKHFSCEY